MSTHASERCQGCGTINKDPFDTYCPDCGTLIKDDAEGRNHDDQLAETKRD